MDWCCAFGMGVFLTVIFALFMSLPGGAPLNYIQAHSWTEIEGIVTDDRSTMTATGDGCNFQMNVQYSSGLPNDDTNYIAQTCWKYDGYSVEDNYMLNYNPNDAASARPSDQVAAGKGMVIGFGIALGLAFLLTAASLEW